MEVKQGSPLKVLILIVCVAILLYAIFSWQNKVIDLIPEVDYDYCVEWGNVERFDMNRWCYDYLNDKPTCDWAISENYLMVFNYSTGETIFQKNCTRYVPSIYVIEPYEGYVEEAIRLN